MRHYHPCISNPSKTTLFQGLTMSNYFEVEASLQEALGPLYKREHLIASFHVLQKAFGPNKDRINRRWRGMNSKSTREPTNLKLKLDKYQNEAL
jgi:hypothetical protein